MACMSPRVRSPAAQAVRCHALRPDRHLLTRLPAVLSCLLPQPLAEGQSRQWEDWEYSYVPMMASAFILYGLAYAYRCASLHLCRSRPKPASAAAASDALCVPSPHLLSPHKNLSEWAHTEAVARMEGGGEDEDEE